jgi:hypothetical protein
MCLQALPKSLISSNKRHSPEEDFETNWLRFQNEKKYLYDKRE